MLVGHGREETVFAGLANSVSDLAELDQDLPLYCSRDLENGR